MSDYLPQDLLVNIFLRLPIKSIVQCTCLSKCWYSLITSPTFITTHLTTTTTNHGDRLFLLRHQSETTKKDHYSLRFDTASFDYYQTLDFPFQRGLHIFGFCNGVICLANRPNTFWSAGSNTIILWNPAIRKSVSLPCPRIASSHDSVLGFGFDSRTDSYKVVMISELRESDYGDIDPLHSLVEVYSLSTGSWRSINAEAPIYHVGGARDRQVFIKGAVHWFAFDQNEAVILLFDMSDEVFCTIKLPEPLAVDAPWNLSLADFKGSLSVSQFDALMVNDGFCSVWVMKEYGVLESWTKLFNINLQQDWIGMTLRCRRNGEVLLGLNNKLLSYSPESKEIKDLEIHIRGPIGSVYLENYVESLILLKEGRQVQVLQEEDGFEGSSDEE